MKKSCFDPIEDVIQAFSSGEIVVMVDDEGRENEGDLICAAEFSFLMSIPLLIGVVIYEGLNWLNCDTLMGINSWVLAWGFLLSAFTGYLALSWLVSLLERGQFWYFGVYCIVAGILSINIL